MAYEQYFNHTASLTFLGDIATQFGAGVNPRPAAPMTEQRGRWDVKTAMLDCTVPSVYNSVRQTGI